MTLSEYVKSRSGGSVKLSDLITESGIARSTLVDWFEEEEKRKRIDLLIDGMIKREIGKYFALAERK